MNTSDPMPTIRAILGMPEPDNKPWETAEVGGD